MKTDIISGVIIVPEFTTNDHSALLCFTLHHLLQFPQGFNYCPLLFRVIFSAHDISLINISSTGRTVSSILKPLGHLTIFPITAMFTTFHSQCGVEWLWAGFLLSALWRHLWEELINSRVMMFTLLYWCLKGQEWPRCAEREMVCVYILEWFKSLIYSGICQLAWCKIQR